MQSRTSMTQKGGKAPISSRTDVMPPPLSSVLTVHIHPYIKGFWIMHTGTEPTNPIAWQTSCSVSDYCIEYKRHYIFIQRHWKMVKEGPPWEEDFLYLPHLQFCRIYFLFACSCLMPAPRECKRQAYFISSSGKLLRRIGRK